MTGLLPPQIGKNRILHDTELAKYNFQSRLNSLLKNAKLDSYPETVRLEGGKGSLDLSDKWVKFIELINTSKAYKFMQVKESGWHNNGMWPKVEQLTFGGNYVYVTRIDGDKCYIKHYLNDENPPDISKSNFYDDTLIQQFWITRKNNTVEYPPCGNCRTIIIARNKSEELWIPKEYLSFVGEVKFPILITVYYGMNLREFPSISAKIIGRIPAMGKTNIDKIEKDNEGNYWGKIENNNSYVCLKLGNQYFTDWRE